MIQGNDYRVLVIGNQVSAVSLRIPAHIVGDGKHTIAQLVEMKNNDERRGEGHKKPLSKIKIDEISLTYLSKQGYTRIVYRNLVSGILKATEILVQVESLLMSQIGFIQRIKNLLSCC